MFTENIEPTWQLLRVMFAVSTQSMKSKQTNKQKTLFTPLKTTKQKIPKFY